MSISLQFCRKSAVLLSQLNTNVRVLRYSSDGFKSILGEPTVQSPFANPLRNRDPSTLSITLTPSLDSQTIQLSADEQKFETLEEATKNIVNSALEDQKKIEKAAILAETMKQFQSEKAEKVVQTAAASTSSSSNSDGGGFTIDEESAREAEKEKRRLRLERNTRIGGYVLMGSTVVGFIFFCGYYGRAPRDEQGNVIGDEFMGSYLAPFYRILNSFKLWRDYVVEPAREKLLPDPLPAGYLQPKYTIIIEMKNVLVHPEWTYKTGYRFAKRPALEYFLDVVGYPNFEVVIYTSESMMTGGPVVESFDPKQRIMYKLFRDCTKYMHGHHVKDLSKLNRDLSKVIFIDFDAKSGQLNPENMLRIPEWKGDMQDTSLVDLAELLKTIHLSDPEDVRPLIQYYSQFDDPAKEFRRRAEYLAQLVGKLIFDVW
ncbi:hypothetical protein WR25_16662 isoform C [Diploscapter pachys]|uniref:Mitochondrial import inner membrane translocase subunit TIM50 n=2 Tax=Diploscapter pachys TaxID=2018661 RepID=A0A2A2KDD2_9BILA|nr:hypothetical protein WR25_16662 isoform C [Diploscapter pachys]